MSLGGGLLARLRGHAMSAHRIVETPRIGMLPTTMAIATHSASRRGDIPCRNRASSGPTSLRLSEFFKGRFYVCARGVCVTVRSGDH